MRHRRLLSIYGNEILSISVLFIVVEYYANLKIVKSGKPLISIRIGVDGQ